MLKNSAFNYWIKHWLAFQLTALNLGVWKFKFLFHDCYKPFLRLFMNKYQVHQFHQRISSHHVKNGGTDYIGMIVDCECARLTKPDKPLNARQTMEKYYPEMREKLEPLLDKLKL